MAEVSFFCKNRRLDFGRQSVFRPVSRGKHNTTCVLFPVSTWLLVTLTPISFRVRVQLRTKGGLSEKRRFERRWWRLVIITRLPSGCFRVRKAGPVKRACIENSRQISENVMAKSEISVPRITVWNKTIDVMWLCIGWDERLKQVE